MSARWRRHRRSTRYLPGEAVYRWLTPVDVAHRKQPARGGPFAKETVVSGPFDLVERVGLLGPIGGDVVVAAGSSMPWQRSACHALNGSARPWAAAIPHIANPRPTVYQLIPGSPVGRPPRPQIADHAKQPEYRDRCRTVGAASVTTGAPPGEQRRRHVTSSSPCAQSTSRVL